MDRVPSTARLKPAGLVVAVVGFLLTRYAVAQSVRMDVGVAPFLVGQAPFLLVGLGLAVYGVALTVGPRRGAYVRTVGTWCLLGVAGVGLVVGLTLGEAALAPMEAPPSASFVPRVLLGGAVGGTLTGRYAGRTAGQRRLLANRADRLTVLNRLLRHEVLNKAAIARGYAGLDGPDAADRIRAAADHIEAVIDRVRFLTGDAEPRAVDLTAAVRAALATARERHPEAAVELAGDPDAVEVYATDHLTTALEHLLETALARQDPGGVRVELGADRAGAWVRVEGEWADLPERQRAILEDGQLPEFDDPGGGFDVPIARLLLDDADATVEVDDAVTVSFRRTLGEETEGLATDRLLAAVAASLVAGVAMGGLYAASTGLIPVIGALYGAGDPAVGWLVHLFHSVVFGLAFAAGVSHPALGRRLRTVRAHALAGVAYGLALAVVAAGVVMPLWLRTIGLAARFPNVTAVGLAGHLLWGVVLGTVFALLVRSRSGSG